MLPVNDAIAGNLNRITIILGRKLNIVLYVKFQEWWTLSINDVIVGNDDQISTILGRKLNIVVSVRGPG